MTEQDDLLDDNEEEKKKKGGKDEGQLSRSETQISPAFFEYMVGIGASKTLVGEILRNWRHLRGEGLLRRVIDFAKSLISSKHVQVEIDRNKDYGVVHNFIQSAKETQTTLTAQQKQEQQRKKHLHNPTHDIHLDLKPKL